MTDPATHTDVERRLVAADDAARHPDSLKSQLEAVRSMTAECWDSLAIEDLTEDEAITFWYAIAE